MKTNGEEELGATHKNGVRADIPRGVIGEGHPRGSFAASVVDPVASTHHAREFNQPKPTPFSLIHAVT